MANEKTNEGLERVIGVSGLTLSIISGVIGVGIFVLPATVGIALGSFAIFSYIVCGILLATILLCYAEIGSRITTSGGSYAYVEAAFGRLPGYIINWLYCFGWGILGSAAVINIVADSLAVLFPVFTTPFVRGLLFFLLILFMILLNIFGAKQSMGFVKAVTVIKLLPLIGIIIFGMGFLKSSNLHWEHFPPLKTFSNTTLLLFFAFAGFEVSLGASGEIKNPKRTVPLSICIGGVVILVVYILLQTVVQGVLGTQIALYKDAPLAAVAEKIIGSAGAVILLLCATLSSFGNVTLDILCTPRVLLAGANDGLFPKFLGKIHPRFATPYMSIIVYGGLIFIFSVAGGFKQLAVLASASILLIYLSVILATIKLRSQKQEIPEKTFKVPGGLIIPLLGIAAIVWLLTSLSKWEIISTLVFITIVVIIYFITKEIKSKKRN